MLRAASNFVLSAMSSVGSRKDGTLFHGGSGLQQGAIGRHLRRPLPTGYTLRQCYAATQYPVAGAVQRSSFCVPPIVRPSILHF